ncbi:hypothetical protein GIB67_010970, partial [Kingdonia uniflora]
ELCYSEINSEIVRILKISNSNLFLQFRKKSNRIGIDFIVPKKIEKITNPSISDPKTGLV